jgi:LCP family protein required for cell wall assembly
MWLCFSQYNLRFDLYHTPGMTESVTPILAGIIGFTRTLKHVIVCSIASLMKNSSSNRNTDGMFVRRRSPQNARASIDGMRVPTRFLSDEAAPTKDVPPTLRGRQSGDEAARQIQYNKTAETPLAASTKSVKPVDIDLTLDDDKGRDGGKKRRRGFRPRKPSKRVVKWVIIVLILIVLGVGGFLAYRVFVASSHIFKGNVLTAAFAQEKKLKTDKYGRTNLLVFGTSESDAGHPGAQLTDSIMIVSIDQNAKTAFLVSVPRDLWVKYDSVCTFGYQGKINTVYECASDDGKNEDVGQQALASKINQTFGVDIQYTVHLNLAVVKDAVDALGGIDIVIESPDPRGILDRNFDWRCNYKCYLVKYPNGPAHLDGEHAMWLAQARNDAGGYGLPRSNFDREANQRKIVIGMKDKATSAGFLANPVAVTNFIESLGNNIHTNIDASEIKTFINVAKGIDSKNIQSISIIDQTPAILTTGTGPDGSSVVKPVSGLYDYSSIQKFMKLQLSGLGAIATEAAKVDVLNGSGVSGAATTVATTLENDAMTIGSIANAPATITGKYQLYDLSSGSKPATLKKLQQELGLSAPTGTTLPAGVTSTASFVVIVGPDAASSTTSTSN